MREKALGQRAQATDDQTRPKRKSASMMPKEMRNSLGYERDDCADQDDGA